MDMSIDDTIPMGGIEDLILSSPLVVNIEHRGWFKWSARLTSGSFLVGDLSASTEKSLLCKIEKATEEYYRALRFY